MAPLSKTTLSMRFMQRNQPGGDTQPAPAIQKARVKRPVHDLGPSEPVASTSKLAEGPEDAVVPINRTGTILRKETSMMAFPILSRSGGSHTEVAMGSISGRRSFGHFNKAVESLHKPPIAAAVKAAPPSAAVPEPPSSDADPTSEDASDSSLEITAIPPPGKKRPHGARTDNGHEGLSTVSGFLKPRLGTHPPRKKKKGRHD